MNTQPTALRLADEMDKAIFPKLCLIDKATDELRRLHSVNQELVEALTNICMSGVSYRETADECFARLTAIARAALAKAGEQA